MRVTSEADRHEARRRWLKAGQAADRLGVSVSQVRKLIAQGALRAMDVSKQGALQREYRIREEWVAAFEEKRTNGSAA